MQKINKGKHLWHLQSKIGNRMLLNSSRVEEAVQSDIQNQGLKTTFNRFF